MKIYSPYQTTSHNFCGIYRHMKNDGWTTKYMSARDIAMMTGQAVAHGIDTWHTHHLLYDYCLSVAIDYYSDNLNHHINCGRILDQQGDVANRKSTEVIKQYLKLALDPIILEGWTNIESEVQYECTTARPDLIGIDPQGVLSVLDYKCVSTFGRKSPEKWLKGQYNGNQAHIYRHAHQVETGQVPERFYICRLTLQPYECTLEYKTYTPLREEQWYQTIETTWNRMEVEDQMGMMGEENPTHENEYGMCEMYDSCIHMNRDVTMMEQTYVQVPRLPIVSVRGKENNETI